jgi:uncharacterized membrane protein
VSTTTPEMTSVEADAYLKEVAPYLAAVPAEERAELLDDLAEHLREIAAEPGPPLVERLGTPTAYAAELLASAGVTATAAPRAAWRTRATSVVNRARASWVGREAARLWPVLRPCWWVLRAYLAVSLLAAFAHSNHYPGFPIPHLAGNAVLGFVAVIIAIPLSVRLGQRSLPRIGRLALIGAGVVLAIYAVVLAGKARSPQVNYIQTSDGSQSSGGCLTNSSGQNITNIYAYGTDGTLLAPVLLYDQDGQPINNLCPNFDDQGRPLTTQYAHDVNGAPVINAFPRAQSVPAQTLPGGIAAGTAGQPNATVAVNPPAVVIPRLAPTSTTLPAGAASTTSPTITVPSGVTTPSITTPTTT